MSARDPVIVVGAGPAGLAVGASLRRAGLAPVLLEAGPTAGHTWRALYDRLRLHTVKALSGLPGLPMPARYPRYPSRTQVADYLDAYARHFDLAIRTECAVQRATPASDGWRLVTSQGELHARALVAATGIFSQPRWVDFPDASRFGGTIQHAATYRNAVPFAGKRVLVVGAGNSGAEIAVDLAEGGATVTVAIREGANVVPRDLLGVPIQRWAHLIARLPRGLTRTIAPPLLRRSVRRQAAAGVPRPHLGTLERPGIPIIGLDFLQLAQAGRIAIRGAPAAYTPDGMRFADGRATPFDAVILATGYRPALSYLADAVPLDADGLPRRAGPRALDAPRLWFAGLTYDIRGTLFMVAREAPAIAAQVATALG